MPFAVYAAQSALGAASAVIPPGFLFLAAVAAAALRFFWTFMPETAQDPDPAAEPVAASA